MDNFFADTYAIIEILKGNKNYKQYIDYNLITTEFNLLEVSYALVRDFGGEKALEKIKLVRDSFKIIKVEDEDFVKASSIRLKFKGKGKNLSLVDCLGYAVALRLGIKFLTGDEEFRDIENVEFVK